MQKSFDLFCPLKKKRLQFFDLGFNLSGFIERVNRSDGLTKDILHWLSSVRCLYTCTCAVLFYCFLCDGKLRSLSLQRTAVVIEGGEFVLSGVLQSRNTCVYTQTHTLKWWHLNATLSGEGEKKWIQNSRNFPSDTVRRARANASYRRGSATIEQNTAEEQRYR